MNIIITGGVGFIGTNAALAFLKKGNNVTLIDNFSRDGVDVNAGVIKKRYSQVDIVQTPVQKIDAYLPQLKRADVVIHLAGQTAVTTSIANPRHDFENNITAGFHLLEAVRKHNPQAIVLYSSTNKVYGDLSHHNIVTNKKKHRVENRSCPQGVDETESIDLISPYGCSKGALDCYMLDYARIFNLNTVVFRQSCIYGPFQMGVEDQGWVAHFTKQFLYQNPITIFGNGLQVRDLLYVEDLVEAYKKAIQRIKTVKGQAINIGGGTKNSFSLVEVITMIEKVLGYTIPIHYEKERSGDQQYFVSKNGKVKKLLSWQPKTAFAIGLESLIDWQKKHLHDLV
ncbi:NAD-dependent epimerase/dehydratase family protein [Candidatus Woesebacteria bacterium]|nr:NAD-dependent epimerase/dehydratase family protein [Candidatus Woesebacteria bacterium]